MKKKLLFITWTFSLGGGAEKMLSVLTRNLDPQKYDIDILEIGKYGNSKEEINSNTTVLSPIFNPDHDSKLTNFIKWQFFKLSPYFLRRLRTNKKYDYEIAFNYLTPVYCLSKNAKTISWNHGSIFNLENEPKNRKKLKIALKDVNKIVAISDLTLESIHKIYPMYNNKTILINNGYEFDKIREKSNEKTDFEIEEDNLIFLGRIEKAKGIIELLDIFKKLVKVIPNKKLYLLGTGELDNYVKEFAKNNNLEDNIIPLGYIKNPYPYIKKAAYITLLSHAEGFPTVFVEGLSLGVGFVSTKVGGTDELSNNGLCGFSSDNQEDILNYLVEQLQLPKEKRIIQKASCLDHVKQYDIKTQISKFENLLENL